MGRQIEVGAVGDALQLTPVVAGEPEAVLDVHGALGVVRQLLLGVLEVPQIVRGDAEVDVPPGALVDPVLVPLLVGAGLDEELHLHLLELPGPEDEVARRDLVPERLAHLTDAEGRLLPAGLHHVGEIDEDALGGLRAQVVQAGLVLDRAQIGLQHHVEVARLRPLAPGAAVRAGDLVQAGGGPTLPVLELLLEVVGPEPLVTGQALGQRIAEHPDVAGGHPDRAGQDDRGVEADDVVAPGDHRAPPLLLDVLLQLDPERAVVPGRPRPAVDLTRGEDEPAPLAQADHLFETVGVGSAGRGHVDSPQSTQRPSPGGTESAH